MNLTQCLSASIDGREGARQTQENLKRIAADKRSKRAAAITTDSFYLGSQQPAGLPFEAANTVHIGQKLKDGSGPYYATLYNKVDHIPVYSAYTVNADQAKKLGTVTMAKRPKFMETPGV